MSSKSDVFNSDGKNELGTNADKSSPLLTRRITYQKPIATKSLSSLSRHGRKKLFRRTLSTPSVDSVLYFYDAVGKLKIDKLLGTGSYSSVYLGMRVSDDYTITGEKVAIKLLNRKGTVEFNNDNDYVDTDDNGNNNDTDNENNNGDNNGDSSGDSSGDRDCQSEYDVLCKYHRSKYIAEFFGPITLNPRHKTDSEIYGFSLEYCKHGDLNSYMRMDQNPNPLRSHQWMIEIVKCVSMLHNIDPPIIHRDIKSSNFLIDSNHHIKITDFGLSRPFIEGSKNDTFKKLRTSLIYTPPEIVRTCNSDDDEDNGMENVYHFPADVYSTTIVMWEILNWTLTGKYNIPHDFNNPLMMIGVLNKGIRPKVKSFPRKWVDFLNGGWHDDPNKRFTIDKMIDEVKLLTLI